MNLTLNKRHYFFADLRADLCAAHELAERIRVSTDIRAVQFTMAFVAPRIASAFSYTYENMTRLVVERNAVKPIANYDACLHDLEQLHSLVISSWQAAVWLTVNAGMSDEVLADLTFIISRVQRAMCEYSATR